MGAPTEATPLDSHIKNAGPPENLPVGMPFDADSAIRQNSEPAMAILYPYIAGLTVMNDQIAAAVSEKSEFQTKPWSRLIGTINAAISLVYGNEEEVKDTAQGIHGMHRKKVVGEHNGIAYEANDASLQKWVLACVFKGTEEAARRWGTPLTDEQKTAVYENFLTFSEAFGIPADVMPTEVDGLNAYWEDALNDTGQGKGLLLQHGISREMAQKIFRFESNKVPKLISRIGQAVIVMSLDERLLKRADIDVDATDRRLSAFTDFILRNTYSQIPKEWRMKALPAYLAVRRRVLPKLGRLGAEHAAA